MVSFWLFRQNPLPVNSFTISKLGLPCKGLFRALHPFIAVMHKAINGNLLIRGFEPQGGERFCAELDGCTSEPISVVLFIGERVT